MTDFSVRGKDGFSCPWDLFVSNIYVPWTYETNPTFEEIEAFVSGLSEEDLLVRSPAKKGSNMYGISGVTAHYYASKGAFCDNLPSDRVLSQKDDFGDTVAHKILLYIFNTRNCDRDGLAQRRIDALVTPERAGWTDGDGKPLSYLAAERGMLPQALYTEDIIRMKCVRDGSTVAHAIAFYGLLPDELASEDILLMTDINGDSVADFAIATECLSLKRLTRRVLTESDGRHDPAGWWMLRKLEAELEGKRSAASECAIRNISLFTREVIDILIDLENKGSVRGNEQHPHVLAALRKELKNRDDEMSAEILAESRDIHDNFPESLYSISR